MPSTSYLPRGVSIEQHPEYLLSAPTFLPVACSNCYDNRNQGA